MTFSAKQRVKNLTDTQIKNSTINMVKFFDFTEFDERCVDIPTGLMYGLEMTAVSLGLSGRKFIEGEDCLNLMSELMAAMNKCAQKMWFSSDISDMSCMAQRATWKLIIEYSPVCADVEVEGSFEEMCEAL